MAKRIMAEGDIAKWLKGQKEQAAKASEESAKGGGGFDRLPDGTYFCELQDIEAGLSKSSDRKQLVWSWDILEGDQEGETIKEFLGLERPQEDGSNGAWIWIFRRLRPFGVDVDRIASDPVKLLEVCQEVLDMKPKAYIQLKTKGEWQNMTIKKIVLEDGAGKQQSEDDEEEQEEQTSASGEEEGAEEEGEDVPISIGMAFSFEANGKTLVGEVTEVDEEAGEVVLKAGKKTYRRTPDQLTPEEDEE